MRAKVLITFEVDTADYFGVPPTQKGIRSLVKEMLQGYADVPAKWKIHVTRQPKSIKALSLKPIHYTDNWL